jgi:hypothetical protein
LARQSAQLGSCGQQGSAAVTKRTRQAKPKSSKRQTKQNKLDHLLAQGTTIDVDIDGRRGVYFKMPTAELQAELDKELDKSIKKRLKADGFELLHAPRRDHPFHSDLLRKRIDGLVSLLGDSYDPSLETEAEQKKYVRTIRDVEAKFGSRPPKEEVEAYVAKVVQRNRRAWAKGFEKYRNMLRDLSWWKGTYVYRAIYPEDGAPLPDGPPPKPVYVSKQSEIVFSIQDGFVNLYTRITALVGSA